MRGLFPVYVHELPPYYIRVSYSLFMFWDAPNWSNSMKNDYRSRNSVHEALKIFGLLDKYYGLTMVFFINLMMMIFRRHCLGLMHGGERYWGQLNLEQMISYEEAAKSRTTCRKVLWKSWRLPPSDAHSQTSSIECMCFQLEWNQV